MSSTHLVIPWGNLPSSLSYDLTHDYHKCGRKMMCQYSKKPPVSPSNTASAVSHSTCSRNFLWAILDGLSRWLEVLTTCNIISWLIERFYDALTYVLYADSSGVLYSVACGYSTNRSGNSVRLFFTLVKRVSTLRPGAYLFPLDILHHWVRLQWP